MQTQQPNMQHAVVEVVMTHARAGTHEKYVLDDEAKAKLDAALREHADDPTLPGGLLGLLGLATVLWNEERSKSAAAAIFTAIGRAAPHLTVVREAEAALATKRFGALVAAEKVTAAPSYNATVPKGTMKASAYAQAHTRVRRG